MFYMVGCLMSEKYEDVRQFTASEWHNGTMQHHLCFTISCDGDRWGTKSRPFGVHV